MVSLDAWVREVVDWHFDPATGCSFWLEYAAKLGWDPRREAGGYVYVCLRPRRIQAWRESNEIAGRTLMRNGEWL